MAGPSRRARYALACAAALVAAPASYGYAHAAHVATPASYGYTHPMSAAEHPHGKHGPNTISTPTGLAVAATSGSSVTLSWKASTDENDNGYQAAYHVYEGGNLVATSMGTSVTVSSLTPATAYSFTVSGYDAAGSESAQSEPLKATTGASDKAKYQKISYFTQWSVYNNPNPYSAAQVDKSGAADKLDILNYAFENIDPTNLTCFEAVKASDTGPNGEQNPNAGDGAEDAAADYQNAYAANTSVDGTTDDSNQPVKGNFNQLRELKVKHPKLKMLLSLGGWTYSKYFSDAAATPEARSKLVSSCIDMFLTGNLPTGVAGDASGGPGAIAGLFDGFDIDWEYPGVVGHVGNHTSPQDKANMTLFFAEFRKQLDEYGAKTGRHFLLTAALPAGQDKIAKIETDQIGKYLDYGNIMTYDMHGDWEKTGPTNFQAPLHDSPKDPTPPVKPGKLRYNIDTTMTAWIKGLPDYGVAGGFPADRITIGFPFYSHGWSGVKDGGTHGLYQPATGVIKPPSLASVAGPAGGRFIPFRALAAPGKPAADEYWDDVTQSPWTYDGSTFLTMDNARSIGVKDDYIKAHGYGGAMMWTVDSDDAKLTLLSAVSGGLS